MLITDLLMLYTSIISQLEEQFMGCNIVKKLLGLHSSSLQLYQCWRDCFIFLGSSLVHQEDPWITTYLKKMTKI